MRKLLLLLTLLLPLLASAQSTSVTATVTDPNGVVYSNGTWKVFFVNRPGFTGIPLLNGSPFTMVFNGSTDNNGTFSVVLSDLSQISPLGSSWRFIICSASSGTCFESIRTEVIGSSINLSAQLSAAAPLISGVSFASIRFGSTETALQIWGASGQSAPLAFMKDAKGKLLWQFSTLGITFPDGTFMSTAGGGGAGNVLNVFGRTGSILAASGDYNFNQLAGSLSLAQTPLTSPGDILFANTVPALARLSVGANGQYLGVASGLPTYLNFPTLSQISGNLLLAQLPLTLRGDLLTVNSTPALVRLALGTNGQCLTSNGLDAVWGSCLAGGASLTADNIWTLTQRFKSGPVFDVSAFLASGSGLQTLANTTANSTTITLVSALNFKNGQGIFLDTVGPGGGPFCSTIVSGAGTTTLVLASAPSATASGVLAVHDDQVAIQAAQDAAEAAGGGVVFFPASTDGTNAIYYDDCVPLHKHVPVIATKGYNSIPWRGASRNAVTIQQLDKHGFRGPGLIIADGPAGYFPVGGIFGPNLLTGGTNSFDGSKNYWLDLRQCSVQGIVPYGCGDVDGVSSLTVEAKVKPVAVSTDSSILASDGVRDRIDGYRSAFMLQEKANGALLCSITTANGTATITGAAGAMVNNTQYHTTLTYDGSNLRCFLNGVQVSGSPAAITGVVRQGQFETVSLSGNQINNTMFMNESGNHFAGLIDGVRISVAASGAAGARYTANFTPPTAKWGTPDANTSVQINFDNNPDDFIVGTTAVSGPVLNLYFFVMGNSCDTSDAQLEQLAFAYNDGIIATLGGGGNGDIRHITSTSSHNGLWFGGNCAYNFTIDDVVINGTGRFGMGVKAGIGRIDHITTGQYGATVQLYIQAGPHISNLFITPTSPTVIPVLVSEVGPSGVAGTYDFVTIENYVSDIEASNPFLQTMLMIDSGNGFQIKIEGAVIECSVANVNCIPITLVNTSEVEIHNAALAPGSNVTPIHIVPATPLLFKQRSMGASVHISDSMYVRLAGAPIGWTDQTPQFPSIPVILTNNTVADQNKVGQTDFTQGFDLGLSPLVFQFPNASSVGTIYPGVVAKMTGASSTAVVTASTDIRGALGCVVGQAGTTFAARLGIFGPVPCIYDAATTANEYVGLSTTLGGTLHDVGVSPGSGQTLGHVLKTAAMMSPFTTFPLTCPSTGGTVAAGTYRGYVTAVNGAEGETGVGTEQTVTCSGATSSLVIGQPSGGQSPGQVGYRVYLTGTNGASNTETAQTITASNCGGANTSVQLKDYVVCSDAVDVNGQGQDFSTYTLTTTPTTGGAAFPSSNTAGPLVMTFLYPEGGAGGSGGTPCTVTPFSIQFNNAGILGCTSATYTSGTGTFNFTQLANGSTLFKLKRFTDTSPTGNLFTLRDAADTVDLARLDATANYLGASYVANGAGAGYLGLSQGASQTTAACPAGGVNCILHQAPTAVTPHMVTWPGVAAKGVLRGNISGSGATLTETISYDTDLKTCMIVIGADNGAVLVDLDLGPQRKICQVPYTATVTEIEIASDAGTPNVIVAKRHCSASPCSAANEVRTNLTSSALATGASGATACSNTGGTAGFDTFTTCTNTLQNTALAVGDWIELTSGTAGGIAVRVSIAVHITR